MPPFYADLHIHSKFSRACSRDCDLEHLALVGRRKGISVIGTGDFTHPKWFEELESTLVPAEPGLFRLREDVERSVEARLPASCRGPVRFMLSVEISTIYKRAERTRKVHHLLYMPDLASGPSTSPTRCRSSHLVSGLAGGRSPTRLSQRRGTTSRTMPIQCAPLSRVDAAARPGPASVFPSGTARYRGRAMVGSGPCRRSTPTSIFTRSSRVPVAETVTWSTLPWWGGARASA